MAYAGKVSAPRHPLPSGFVPPEEPDPIALPAGSEWPTGLLAYPIGQGV